jgi:hypothetical protein
LVNWHTVKHCKLGSRRCFCLLQSQRCIVSTSSEQLPAQPTPRPWPLYPEAEPVFGIPTVIVTFIAIVLAVLFCGALTMAIAHNMAAFSRVPMAQLSSDPRVILPAQLAAYMLVFGTLWRLFQHHYRIGFFPALSWRWPRRAAPFLVGGVVLALAAQFSAHYLPAPPELPIDKMMRTSLDAWLMTAFGVFIAPFAEEVLFRGLLFPALTRRAGLPASLVITSVLFGIFHAQQLAGAWIQITCIIVVGAVLTIVRWRSRSLACSTLVHVGYNGALFSALLLQTQGFTNLSAH